MPKQDRIELYKYLSSEFPELVSGIGQNEFIDTYADARNRSKLYTFLKNKVPDVFGETERERFMVQYGDDLPISTPKSAISNQENPPQQPTQSRTVSRQPIRQSESQSNKMAKQTTGVQQGEYMTFLNSVPTVGTLDYVPTFVAQDLDLKYLDKNQKDFLDIFDKQRADAQQGFNDILEAQDKILKLRADNPYQAQTIDNLKAGSGFDNTLFDLDEEDFENPFKVKEIESRAARIVTNQDYLNIMRDQAYHDNFLKELDTNVCSGKNANSALCKMGREELNKYLSDQNGSFRGGALRAADFTPLDWMKVLKDDLDKVPIETFMGDVIDGNGYFMVKEFERRGRELVTSLIKNRTNDRQFANNLYADGYTTEASIEKLKNDLINAWTQESIKKFEFKLEPRAPQTPVWRQQADYNKALAQQALSGRGFTGRYSSIMEASSADAKTKLKEKIVRASLSDYKLGELGKKLDKYDLNAGEQYAEAITSMATKEGGNPEEVFQNMGNDLLGYGEASALEVFKPSLALDGAVGNEVRKALENLKNIPAEQLERVIPSLDPKSKEAAIYNIVKNIPKYKGMPSEHHRILWNLNETASGREIPTGQPQQQQAPQPVQQPQAKTQQATKKKVNF